MKLRDQDRAALEMLLRDGENKVRRVKRAQILLHADDGKGREHIAEAVGVSRGTVQRISQPEGRVLRQVLTCLSMPRGSFNPHLARRPGATSASR